MGTVPCDAVRGGLARFGLTGCPLISKESSNTVQLVCCENKPLGKMLIYECDVVVKKLCYLLYICDILLGTCDMV